MVKLAIILGYRGWVQRIIGVTFEIETRLTSSPGASFACPSSARHGSPAAPHEDPLDDAIRRQSRALQAQDARALRDRHLRRLRRPDQAARHAGDLQSRLREDPAGEGRGDRASISPRATRRRGRRTCNDMLESFINNTSSEFDVDHIEEDTWKKLADTMQYVRGDMTKPDLYRDIGQALDKAGFLDRQRQSSISPSPTASSRRSRSSSARPSLTKQGDKHDGVLGPTGAAVVVEEAVRSRRRLRRRAQQEPAADVGGGPDLPHRPISSARRRCNRS